MMKKFKKQGLIN